MKEWLHVQTGPSLAPGKDQNLVPLGRLVLDHELTEIRR